ncbi:TPA: NAD-dependent epimerase/dehydratase family protein, partial [Streptococcus suis]
DTKEIPTTYYGKSKLEAEKLLVKLNSDSFKVVSLRPPMVYGPNAKGNYSRLSKLAKITVIFPKIENQRSMIYIDNLLEFVRKTIELDLEGLYFPQNSEYICTSELVRTIREVNGKNTILLSIFNPLIRLFSKSGQFNKLFGNLVYEKKISNLEYNYNIVDFENSIEMTEGTSTK